MRQTKTPATAHQPGAPDEDAPEQTPRGSILAGWISRRDLACELGLTEDTLRRWEGRRIGPVCVRAGRRAYYRRTAVQDWLSKQETAKQPRGRGRR